MVYRLFVEKKKGLTLEADALKADINGLLGIKGVTEVRLLNRYDAENITEENFKKAVDAVFSEPQLDTVTYEFPYEDADTVFASEYLPGQFDMRADSAAQCIQLMSCDEKPLIRSARVYAIYGSISEKEKQDIIKYVINPVESRVASMDKPETLVTEYDIPTTVPVIEGFIDMPDEELVKLVGEYGLAMDGDDVLFCRDYFRSENKNPTMTELRVIDTYWSDHCRHTTFLTEIDSVKTDDPIIKASYEDYLNTRKELNRTKPETLMDIGTIGARYLKAKGLLDKMDESEEINACTVKIKVETENGLEDWLLLFKNETHNHPTEIEPFGGAATCIGGAIRDPLSGRSYVYAAMRVTGAGDPTKPLSQTIAGKLPQRKIVTTAAAGYSSYGNQIGLATGQVDEIYHPGYAAKRMEIGAVIAAAPEENVRREVPDPDDVVILLGGRTGRDGCGGATGSSKSHTLSSIETCGSEVQKGNAPEERKLQRLFRNPEASRLIKRCNDFGAGGVSVAIGELADGLTIDLNAVPKKYDGLDGTEIAISESQERMAVVVEPKDVARFCELAKSENLEATVVAKVTAEPRLRMHWNGKTIVDLSREFLNSNGAEKHINITPAAPEDYTKKTPCCFKKGMTDLAGDLNICSKRGLSERFDSTIGAGTVMMPFGGKNQLTPSQCMVNKVSVEKKHTNTCSFMAWGYNPFVMEKSPYHGAYLAVVESVSKLISAGASFEEVYLTFQEYFERPNTDSKRWGKPLSALLGAFKAQKELGIASIGGKDSMSGTFEDLDVPPTLCSFAVTVGDVNNVVSPEFKEAGHKVYLVKPEYDKNGLPVTASLLDIYNKVYKLITAKKAVAVWTPIGGGIAEGIMKMSFGNDIGFKYADDVTLDEIFGYNYGAFIIEMTEDCGCKCDCCTLLGETTADGNITMGDTAVAIHELLNIYEYKLEPVFSCNIEQKHGELEAFSYTATERKAPAIKCAKPHVVIPVFPGTNCEFDSAKAFNDAGAEAEIIVINNLSSDGIQRSVEKMANVIKNSQIIFIPGGFSGGDEPDGSGKFITAFFRNAAIKEQVSDLLDNRDGLMAGICNGFQAIIKLGLVPYGKIIDTDENCPTLTYNTIGRHQSRIVRTRIASNKSPWLAETNVGDIYNVPISHGEGRFLASNELVKELAKNGQIATQYVDLNGNVTADVRFNPNNSVFAIEGITSPDGRVFGKMGHSERIGHGLYNNVIGNYEIGMFRSAVKYFK